MNGMTPVEQEVVRVIRGMNFEPAKQDPECFYQLTEGGIWYPDSLHKPFLHAAVQELRTMQREYQRLSAMFCGDSNA